MRSASLDELTMRLYHSARPGRGRDHIKYAVWLRVMHGRGYSDREISDASSRALQSWRKERAGR